MAVLTDIRDGLRVIGRNIGETINEPFGPTSANHRMWLMPIVVVVFSIAPIVGALFGKTEWFGALVFCALLNVATTLMLIAMGRWDRRSDRRRLCHLPVWQHHEGATTSVERESGSDRF